MPPFLINLPDTAFVPPPPAKPGPQGLLGLGANYYQPHQNPNDASVFLKQAYLEFRRESVARSASQGRTFRVLRRPRIRAGGIRPAAQMAGQQPHSPAADR